MEMPETLDLKFLYYFSNPSSSVLEVKILNLPEGTPIGKIYHWLSFDQSTQQFQKLSFKSMSSEEGREYRAFDQGDLWFDGSQATMTLNSQTSKITFSVKNADSVPDNLIAQVQTILQRLIL